MVDTFLDWLVSLPPGAVYPVLMLASALENVFPPVPADVAVALGAWISREGGLNALLLGLACWSANTASAVGVYALGRRWGEALLERPWARALLPPPVMRGIREAYARHGVGGIFWSRFLPGLRAGVMPFAGIVGMPARRAVPPALLASAIWYAGLVAVGTAFGLEWADVRALVGQANRVLAVLAAVAITLLALWLRRRSGGRPPSATVASGSERE
jgi:membrane protein DedA with SNARE-associated domain